MNLKALRVGCASRGAEVSCKQHRQGAKESQATLCYFFLIGIFAGRQHRPYAMMIRILYGKAGSGQRVNISFQKKIKIPRADARGIYFWQFVCRKSAQAIINNRG